MNKYYHAANVFMGLALYVPTGNIWMTRHGMMEHLRKRGFGKSVDYLSDIPGIVLEIIDISRELGILEALPTSEVVDSGGIGIVGEGEAKTYEDFERQSVPIHRSSFIGEYTYNNGKRVMRIIGTGRHNAEVEHIREMQNTARIIGRTRAIKSGLIQPINFGEHHLFEIDLAINPETGEEEIVGESAINRAIEEMDSFILHRDRERARGEVETGFYGYEYLRIIDDVSLEKSRVFYRRRPSGKKNKPPTETLAEKPLLA